MLLALKFRAATRSEAYTSREGSDPNRRTLFATSTSNSHLIRSLHVFSRTRSEPSRLIRRTNLKRRVPSKSDSYLTNAASDETCIYISISL